MNKLEGIRLTTEERKSLQEISQVLKSRLPVSRVILFGSKARGDAAPDSDMDLLVLTSCPVTGKLRDEISESLADINLRDDIVMSSISVSEEEWNNGLIHYAAIHREVERDGCEL